jgi:pimeloyl-ACP methyl ester carboxylesterase
MNRRQLAAAALLPLVVRSAPAALISKTRAATLEHEEKMNEPKQRIIESNGIRLNIAEQGEGPLVLLAHGFPESWYSWRHQISVLAAGGFHVVAPDMRGYGKSDAPQAIDQYTMLHLVGDMVGVLDALSAPTAAIVGHDWGASVAWGGADTPGPLQSGGGTERAVPPPRRGVSDHAHAAHRECTVLPALLPGAGACRSRTGA